MLIRELYSCLDIDEALRCVRELKSSSHSNLIYQAIMISFDMKDTTRKLCVQFLDQLMTEGVISGDALVEALTHLVEVQ